MRTFASRRRDIFLVSFCSIAIIRKTEEKEPPAAFDSGNPDRECHEQFI
jgi:hypothetical protein